MKDQDKEKQQLIRELVALRERIAELEKAESRRKLVEEALGESEQRYRSLFKNNHSVMLLIDPESADIVDANQAACSYYGWSQEEMTSMKITDINMLSNEQVFEEMERARSEERQHFLFRHRLANKEIRDVEVYSGPIRLRGKELLYSIIHDITERKQAERALRQREKRFREMAENIHEVFWLFDLREERVIYVSPAYEEIWGRSIQDLYNRYGEWADSVHPDDRSYAEESFATIASKGGGVPREYRIVRPDGTVRWVSDRGFAINGKDGQVLRIAGIAEDITERKRVENDLRESKERYRSLVENIDLGITQIDANHTIQMVNSAAARFFDKPASYFIGKKCFREFEQRGEVCSHCPGTKAMATGHQAAIKTEGVREDGRLIPVKIRAFPTFESDGTPTGFIEVIEDISEKKQAKKAKRKLQAQLLQAKKLEAIANLSGGVAQELENLFQTVQGYIEQFLWHRRKDDTGYQELLDITHAALRGARLTRKLLAFSGTVESTKQPFDLNKEVKRCHQLLKRTMPEHIKLELHLADDPMIIDGDPALIEQALIALAVNAKDAMPEGGKITISTKRVVLDEEFRRIHDLAEVGECVLLTISDTGCGLGQETLEHIFDPFYGKKGFDENRGLGLSIVYGIVKNHDGYISCSSEPDSGSTFSIYLPVIERDEKPGSEEIMAI